MGQKRGRALVEEGFVGRAAALRHEQELVGVGAFLIEVDLGRQVVAGVLFLEHLQRRELRIAQVLALVSVEHAARQRIVVAAIGPDVAAFLAHDDRRASILAHRQHAAGGDVGVLQQVIGNEAVVVGGLRVVEDMGELAEMAGAQQMVDVGEGGFGQQAHALRLDGQDVLALERVDRDMVGTDLAIGCGVFAERKKRICHRNSLQGWEMAVVYAVELQIAMNLKNEDGRVAATAFLSCDLWFPLPQPGWIIRSGRTMESYCSAVTRPVFRASSRSVVPFLWAVLAILAALS